MQLGLNLGPRHARVLGWAKSYKKNLDQPTRIKHDQDAVGAVSVLWSLLQSVMPRDVLDTVDECLGALHLPRIATRDIKQGMLSGLSLSA